MSCQIDSKLGFLELSPGNCLWADLKYNNSVKTRTLVMEIELDFHIITENNIVKFEEYPINASRERAWKLLIVQFLA